MPKYSVYYAKKFDSFCESAVELEKTHAHIKEIEASDMEEVFMEMQGENWSPNGEARGLIRMVGTDHTSMSVGDVLVNKDTNERFQCASAGWEAI